MLVEISSREGPDKCYFGVSDFEIRDGEVALWFPPSAPEEVDHMVVEEGQVSRCIDTQSFDVRGAIDELANLNAGEEPRVTFVATDRNRQFQQALAELRNDSTVTISIAEQPAESGKSHA